MAYVFHEKRRRPIPEGAEIIRRRGGKVARWVSNGRTYSADVDGDSVIIEGRVYYARWRGADGRTHTASTGCHDKAMAEKWLSRKMNESERIKSGVITQTEADTATRATGMIDDALNAFESDLKTKRRTGGHIKETVSFIKRAASTCGWRLLRDMDGIQAGEFLRGLMDAGKSSRTHNKALVSLAQFGRWCVKQRLILSNPFDSLSRLSEKADKRYRRRALTTDEVSAIITAARMRPVMEATKDNKRGKGAKLSEDETARLEWKGWNRALAYRLMSVSGLRWNECRTLSLSDVHTDADTPYITIQASREKARRGAQIPLHGAIVDEVVSFIKARKQSLTGDSTALNVIAFPGDGGDVPLFDDLPLKVSPQFKADCKAARYKTVDASGREKISEVKTEDEFGRVADVHCLRYYFGTELARAGVPLHVVQKLMRHSTPTLTSAVYIHATLNDLGAAVDLLPDMGAALMDEKQTAEATADTTSHTTLNPTLANVKTLHFASSDAVSGDSDGGMAPDVENAENACNDRDIDATIRLLPGWRNRQTHRTQNPAVAIP